MRRLEALISTHDVLFFGVSIRGAVGLGHSKWNGAADWRNEPLERSVSNPTNFPAE